MQADVPPTRFVAGKPIIIKNQVVGKGGTTPQGQHTAADSGLPYQVLDLVGSKLYGR